MCFSYLGGGGQGCCPTSCNAQTPQTREARAQSVHDPGAEKPWFVLMNKTVSLSSCSWW